MGSPIRLIGQRIVFIAIIGLVAGCATHGRPAPPLEAPPANVGVWHFAGDAVAGRADATSVVPLLPIEQAQAVRVRWIALSRMTARDSAPLSSSATLITAVRGGTPVLPSGELTRNVRVANGDGAAILEMAMKDGNLAPAAPIAESVGVLSPGITAVFTVEDPQLVPDPMLRAAATRRLTIAARLIPPAATNAPSTQPAASSVEVALLVEDLVHAGSAEASMARELAVLDPATIGDGPERAVIVPFRFSGSRGKISAVLAVIDVTPSAEADDFPAIYVRAQDNLKAAPPDGAVPAAWQPRPNWTSLDVALAALSTGSRAALAQAATEAGAPLCGELALSADDATAKRLAERVRSKFAGPTMQSKDAVAWEMDSACIELLAEMETAGPLPPEVISVLAVLAGETGRSAATLAELARSAGSVAEFEQRVAAENYIDLEDNSPAARVRAFDWLRTRKLAPAGYDPLGPPRQRRAALDKAAEQPAAPAPTADTK
jgi:hypothetical protein